MKFGLVNGQRQEAQPDLFGECPGCGRPVIAKCGAVRVWHWAHKGRQLCDPWWENETEWHRAWKDHFPADWQEIVHTASNGEHHIADVKTRNGWVIEFQHSHITPEERRSRDSFYPQLVWVVDGMRRKRDKAHVVNAWEGGVRIAGTALLRKASSDNSALLREWADSSAPIFIDLGDKGPLMCLLPMNAAGWVYLHPILRAQFIDWHRDSATAAARPFEEFVRDLPKLIADYEARSRAQPSGWPPLRGRGPRRHFRL